MGDDLWLKGFRGKVCFEFEVEECGTVKPGFNSARGNAGPSTRTVLTGNGNRSPVNSGR